LTINREDGSIKEVLELKTKRLKLDERLTDKNRIWGIPEWIGILVKGWLLTRVEVVIKDISDNEHSVSEFVSWPLVVVTIFLVINLDHDFSLALRHSTLFVEEGIQLLDNLGREANLSAKFLTGKVGLVNERKDLIEFSFYSLEFSLKHLLLETSSHQFTRFALRCLSIGSRLCLDLRTKLFLFCGKLSLFVSITTSGSCFLGESSGGSLFVS
jgi:hypothetical protein